MRGQPLANRPVPSALPKRGTSGGRRGGPGLVPEKSSCSIRQEMLWTPHHVGHPIPLALAADGLPDRGVRRIRARGCRALARRDVRCRDVACRPWGRRRRRASGSLGTRVPRSDRGSCGAERPRGDVRSMQSVLLPYVLPPPGFRCRDGRRSTRADIGRHLNGRVRQRGPQDTFRTPSNRRLRFALRRAL